jgi:hypothetical protein
VDERIKRASAEAERTRREPAATAQRHDEEPAEIQRQSREGPSPALMALLGMLLGAVFFAAGMAFMKIIVG